ncbi:hypothetical protein [Microbulbifer sp. Q7]|uniref:hypothetical protein n=1 Tax=Microbulbifer sp. Q7 TaxID=1785091 RepID=UPI000AA28BCB|nr:hypothetical protein [Microbulbifer sp. Q7]
MKVPRKNKHWLEEMTVAMENNSYGSVVEEYSTDTSEVLKLAICATKDAAKNRGISKASIIENVISEIEEIVRDEMSRDLEPEGVSLEIQYFLSYLDANVLFGVISERKAEEIMNYYTES